MISPLELKKWLRVTSADEDDLISTLEVNAVAYMQNSTGRYFGPLQEFTEVISGAGDGVLRISEPPVASPAPVIEYFDGSTWSAVDASKYTIDGYTLYSSVGTTWVYGDRNYRVTYWRGYPEGEEPGDIRQAVLQLCALWYEYRTPVIESVVPLVPFTVQAIINNNRRIRV